MEDKQILFQDGKVYIEVKGDDWDIQKPTDPTMENWISYKVVN